MKALVTGASGMLGSDIVEAFSRKGWDVFGLGHKDGDVTDVERLRETLKRLKPDTVVHCAAFTDVDGCENDPDKAFRVNGMGTKNVALSCREAGSSMVYVSTDYLFDGTKDGSYDEVDQASPINVYGRSKLLGEYYVQHLLERFSVIRTSWLFGGAGKNFVKTVLRLLKIQDRLTMVDDQVGSPTYTKDLAGKIGEVVDDGGCGIYHITNSGSCSWYEFTLKIMEYAEIHGKTIEPVSSNNLGRPAKRPGNSVLENRILRLEGYGLLRSWEEALKEYINYLQPSPTG